MQYVILRENDPKVCNVLRVSDREAVVVARIIQSPACPDINPVEVGLLACLHYSDPAPDAAPEPAGAPAPATAPLKIMPAPATPDGGEAFRFSGGASSAKATG